MPVTFNEHARAAFDPVAEAAELEFEEQCDETWLAWVKWSRDGVGMRVSDDRRDRLIEIVVTRPITGDDDVTALSQLVRGTELALPLWAIVESLGGTTDYDHSGDQRVDRLPAYAQAVRAYAMAFLTDPQAPVDAVAGVVRQRNWESSEEGRRTRRFLP